MIVDSRATVRSEKRGRPNLFLLYHLAGEMKKRLWPSMRMRIYSLLHNSSRLWLAWMKIQKVGKCVTSEVQKGEADPGGALRHRHISHQGHWEQLAGLGQKVVRSKWLLPVFFWGSCSSQAHAGCFSSCLSDCHGIPVLLPKKDEQQFMDAFYGPNLV